MEYSKDFETLWSSQPIEYWVKRAPERFQVEWDKNKKMNTAGDWLSLVPVALVIVYMDKIPVTRELLRYAIAALVIILWFVVWSFLKPFVTGKRSYADIEADVKDYFHEQFARTGKA